MNNIKKIKTQRALSLSGINITDYVINPYKGCEFGCIFCYVQKNKNIQKIDKVWGNYVYIKENIIEILSEDIKKANPNLRILLGSTTDPYQPIEKTQNLVRQILLLLSKYDFSYTILTRSPLVTRDIDIIQSNPDNKIIFTISPYTKSYKNIFEPNSPGINQRIDSINILDNTGINVIPYISPVIPHIFEFKSYLNNLSDTIKNIQIETLNSCMANIDLMLNIIKHQDAEYYANIKSVYNSQKNYNTYWTEFQEIIKNKYPHYNIMFYITPYDRFYKSFLA